MSQKVRGHPPLPPPPPPPPPSPPHIIMHDYVYICLSEAFCFQAFGFVGAYSYRNLFGKRGFCYGVVLATLQYVCVCIVT